MAMRRAGMRNSAPTRKTTGSPPIIECPFSVHADAGHPGPSAGGSPPAGWGAAPACASRVLRRLAVLEGGAESLLPGQHPWQDQLAPVVADRYEELTVMAREGHLVAFDEGRLQGQHVLALGLLDPLRAPLVEPLRRVPGAVDR